MRMRQTVLGGMLAGALLLAPWGASAQAEDGPDQRLEDRVEKNLKHDDKLEHLDVDVKDGVTTIKGEVASTAERARAEKLAHAAGAKTVVNQVTIDADKAVARIKDRAEAKKDKIDDQARRYKLEVDRQTELAKDRTEHKLEPATHPAVHNDKEVFDPLVTAKVKTKITKDDLLDKSEINVDTDANGLVTLKGSVPSEAAHTRAIELARTTDGVRKVVDHLVVKAPVVK